MIYFEFKVILSSRAGSAQSSMYFMQTVHMYLCRHGTKKAKKCSTKNRPKTCSTKKVESVGKIERAWVQGHDMCSYF
jgi:hypothetical protein